MMRTMIFVETLLTKGAHALMAANAAIQIGPEAAPVGGIVRFMARMRISLYYLYAAMIGLKAEKDFSQGEHFRDLF